MTEEEIENYCAVGSAGVCVYRKRVKKAQFIIQSIYIFRSENGGYLAHVEFDPMSMVEAGEGIKYRSKNMSLSSLVKSIEKFSNLAIGKWENHSKSGKVPFYDSEDITAEHYQRSWSVLTEKYDDGRSLLPLGLSFE